MSSSYPVRVLVINLARRPDRLLGMSQQLSALDVPFERVEAVDGRSLSQDVGPEASSYITRVQGAVISSHIRAWHIAQASPQAYSLILEDDAWLDPRIPWKQALVQLAQKLSEVEIDALQLGHLTFGLRGRVHYWATEAADALPKRRLTPQKIRVDVNGHSIRIRLGVMRAGTHCYLVSRGAASMLGAMQPPFLFHIDGILARLASSQAALGGLTFASTVDLLATQGGDARRPAPDSDNG